MEYHREPEHFGGRQQRVLEAKAAFGKTPQRSALPQAPTPQQEFTGHPFRLLRVMTAWVLLLVLLAAFYNDFSYRGFDREYVQERLEDDSVWQALEERVQGAWQAVMVHLEQ